MYKKILVPVDLTEPDFAKPAIDAAVELARQSGGIVRIVNVLPMTPVMLAEYVPADFDTQQRQTAEESVAKLAKESGLDSTRLTHRRAPGRHLSRSARRSRTDGRRPDRDGVASASAEDLFPRLQCRPRRALREVFGAGRARD